MREIIVFLEELSNMLAVLIVISLQVTLFLGIPLLGGIIVQKVANSKWYDGDL